MARIIKVAKCLSYDPDFAMSLFETKSNILITCGRGISPYLAMELKKTGFTVTSEHPYGVETEGTMCDAMTLNLAVRTGQRVLYRITSQKARTPKEFYHVLRDLPWEEYIDPNEYLTVTSVVDTQSIRDSRFANLKAKDAIVDRLFAEMGRRPDSGPERRGATVHCYWKGDRCDIYIDTSGEPLSKRGYRVASVEAPLQESLATALIMASGWSDGEHFVNPMCGSGTFAIEAALMALDRAPGLLRNSFGFMHIKGFRKSAWKSMRNSWNRRSKISAGIRIIATDIDETAVAAARENAEAAGMESFIEFAVAPFQETTIPVGRCLIMINPEYGKRLGNQHELEEVYRRMGDFLKQRCAGNRAAIFTGNLHLAKNIGLKTSRRLTFYNGGIECRLLCYDLYEGGGKKRPPSANREVPSSFHRSSEDKVNRE